MRFRYVKRLGLVTALILLGLAVFNSFQTWAYPQPDPTGAASVRGYSRPMSGNLVYHGGQMVTAASTAYTIYWIPNTYSVSANYRTLINSFLANVAADSGKTSNVYYSLTQYTNASGTHAAYNISFGGSVIDTNPFPASGCSSSFAQICLTDTQIQDELNAVMISQGWIADNTHLYFFLTPNNVATCFDGTGTYCSFKDYCAYHNPSHTGALYAAIAYPTLASTKCGSFQTPNGDTSADSAINLISHEHNELITDPYHSAWYDNSSTKAERGDKCAWNFGTALGWTSQGGKYNQVINGHKYWLQPEWSNQSSSCVLTGL